jgi:hypothetical protein
METKSKKLVLTRGKTLNFLEKLSTTQDNIFQTLYLPPNLPNNELKTELKELRPPKHIIGDLIDSAVRSPTGAILFWSEQQQYLVVPPFYITEKSVSQSLDLAPLQSLLNHRYQIGIVLVRLGAYAVGFCRGDKLVNSKVGTGLVHSRHRQGGSSAHRFERHRDKQIESFLTRVCGHVREQLEPHIKTLDYIVYGGARTTILSLQKHCPLLMELDKPTLPPLLDIPEPRRAVLESAIGRIWSSTIYSWTED